MISHQPPAKAGGLILGRRMTPARARHHPGIIPTVCIEQPRRSYPTCTGRWVNTLGIGVRAARHRGHRPIPPCSLGGSPLAGAPCACVDHSWRSSPGGGIPVGRHCSGWHAKKIYQFPCDLYNVFMLPAPAAGIGSMGQPSMPLPAEAGSPLKGFLW